MRPLRVRSHPWLGVVRDANFGSEIRRACPRRCGFSSGREVAEPAFGADMLLPGPQRDRIRDGGGPGHREDAGILDRELKLQVLAAIARIEFQRLDARTEPDVLLAAALDRRLGLGIVDE